MSKWDYKWKPIENYSKEELIDIVVEMVDLADESRKNSIKILNRIGEINKRIY
jgi:hypothetical protein